MKKIFALTLTGCLLFGTQLFADFSYRTETKFTGGALGSAMKMAMKMSKTARSQMVSTVYIKGDLMANVNESGTQIVDLANKKFINIDHRKKEYSETTFAEMNEAMQRLAEKQEKEQDATSFDLKIDNRGDKKDIGGYPAELTVLHVSIDREKESESMDMLADLWLAKGVAGQDEVTSFYKRMGEELEWSPGSAGVMAMSKQQKGLGEAIAAFYEEAKKAEGISVLSVMRVGPDESFNEMKKDVGKLPSEDDDDGGASPSIGGIMRSLGGFGGGSRNSNSQPSGTLMELAIYQTDFSTSAIEAAKFEVPAGYKKVESDFLKNMR
jgi:hypothetical protein